MASNIITVASKGAPLNSTEFDNNLLNLKCTADDAMAGVTDLKSGAVKAGDSYKLDGKTVGTGADNILHTDENGNVGVSVTPSEWNEAFNVLELDEGCGVIAKNDNGSIRLVQNAYIDASDVWRYKSAGKRAYLFNILNGEVYQYTSATAENADDEITWVQVQLTDANGDSDFKGRLTFKALTSESSGYSSMKRTGDEDSGAILELLSDSGSRFKVQKNGNVGMGVEPYDWNPDWTALDIKDAALIDIGNGGAYLSANAYYDGTNWRYKNAGAATCLVQTNGKYIFRKASAGSAGDVITWTENFRVNSDGQSFTYSSIYAGRDGYGNYRDGENGVYAYAKSSNNTTAIWGRDAADSTYVFQSKVGNITRSRISAAGEAYFAEGVRFGNSGSHTLDYYKEGTVTGTTGEASYHYEYTRVGNLVHVQGTTVFNNNNRIICVTPFSASWAHGIDSGIITYSSSNRKGTETYCGIYNGGSSLYGYDLSTGSNIVFTPGTINYNLTYRTDD